MEYSRNLTSYSHMINDNNDLQRLKYLINDLKDKEVLVDVMIDDNDQGRKGNDLIREVIGPIVKNNTQFTDYLMTVVYSVCFEKYSKCIYLIDTSQLMENQNIWPTSVKEYDLLGLIGRVWIISFIFILGSFC